MFPPPSRAVVSSLQIAGIRVSIFVDPHPAAVGVDRVFRDQLGILRLAGTRGVGRDDEANQASVVEAPRHDDALVGEPAETSRRIDDLGQSSGRKHRVAPRLHELPANIDVGRLGRPRADEHPRGRGRVAHVDRIDHAPRRGADEPRREHDCAVELDPQLIQESRELAAKAGVADRVRFIQGDLFTNDFSEASVVVLYLGHGANLDLRAQLVRTLKPGARVVSHQFGMGEWPADKLLDVRTQLLGMYGEFVNEFRTNPNVPDFDGIGSRASHDVLSVWMVPAPVAGVWHGRVALESGTGELKLTLHQRLSDLTGEFELLGATNLQGRVQTDLWGGDVRWHCIPTNAPYGGFLMWFDGHVDNDTMKGTLWVSQDRNTREVKWTARRDPADFSGVWQWTGAFNTPVQLKIERRDGRLAATYVDTNRTAQAGGNQPIPVTDLHDFGGGFYFTLLLGLEGQRMSQGSRRTGPENGWLIGEAIAELQSRYPGIKERLVDDNGEVRRFVNVYVNEEDIRFLKNQQTPLKDGDEISIIPAIAGG